MRTFKDYVLLKENTLLNMEEITTGMNFLPTSKKKLTYRYVNPDQTKEKLEMPPLSYTICDRPRSIQTVVTSGHEGFREAKAGDVLISGVNQEMYVMSPDKFKKNYTGQIGGPVVVDQTPRLVAQYQGGQSGEFMASFGDPMQLNQGDYLVKDGEGFYRIAKEEYEQTYNPPGKIG